MTSRTQSNSLTIGQRLQALSLIEHGISAKVVQAITEVSIQSISSLKRKARDRGYDPTVSRVLKVEYVQDAQVTPAIEQTILNVRHDRNGREKSSAVLGYEHAVSSTVILGVLRRNNFRSCKSTMKPGLDSAMKEARLQFCLRYRHWTLEDWKNFIWSDETSVVLGSRRGRRLQWRTSKENMLRRAFDVDGKDVPNSCFGVVIRMKRKVLFIYGSRRLHQKNGLLKQKLTKSIRR